VADRGQQPPTICHHPRTPRSVFSTSDEANTLTIIFLRVVLSLGVVVFGIGLAGTLTPRYREHFNGFGVLIASGPLQLWRTARNRQLRQVIPTTSARESATKRMRNTAGKAH
jgi:hypothetical protein